MAAQKIPQIKESNPSRGSWDFSNHVYEKPKKRAKRESIHYPAIECISDIIEDYNGKGNLGVTLKFNGFSFSEELFSKSKKDYGENTCVYYIPISYKKRGAFLILSMLGDILEYEVVPRKKGISQLFKGEIAIPELIKIYDPLSMEVMLNNGIVLVAYKKEK